MEWRAQPRQKLFLRAEEDEVLYGGAAGGGKTDALIICGVRLNVRYPGSKVLFLRRTFADLDKPGAAISRSHELLTGSAAWDGNQHRWTFANGSIFQFGHLQHDKDVYSYQGAQLDGLLWDELTQFEYEQYQFLRSRVRATVQGVKPIIRGATNPGGVGHGWVKARWIDAAPWEQSFVIQGQPIRITGRFIPAKVADNPALTERDPGYAGRMADLPEQLRKAYLEGSWDIFAGQVFTEWRYDVHTVDPFPIPKEWKRWRALDWGYNKPFCCLWFARSPEGRVYVYRELYAAGLTDSEQAKQVRKLSAGESIRFSVADPACWNRNPNGTSIAQVWADHWLATTPGNHDRLAGWQRVHDYLAWGEGRQPALVVFRTCPNLIRTLPAQVYDEHKVEDVDTDGEDHAADTLRYGLMAASSPRPQATTREFEFVP